MYVEGAVMFLFEALRKAKTASRGREIFPSGKILVIHKNTKNLPFGRFFRVVEAGGIFCQQAKCRGGVAKFCMCRHAKYL